jgi:hypothetical protein
VTYRSATGDNFFRKTHYWLLEGEGSLLREVIVGTGFERSDEDAKSVVTSAGAALEISLSSDDVVEGYEWDRDRDSWYLLLKGGTRAIYVQ